MVSAVPLSTFCTACEVACGIIASLIVWGLMAISAQTGYIVHLKSML